VGVGEGREQKKIYIFLRFLTLQIVSFVIADKRTTAAVCRHYVLYGSRGRDEVRFCGDARRGERAMVYIMTLYRNAKGKKRKMEFRCGGPPGAASLRCRLRKRGARSAAVEEAQTRGLLSRPAVCPRPRQIAI